MEAIIWKRGDYQKFYANMKVRIGANTHNLVAIEAGDELEYDGTMLRYAGAEVPQPSLRGAVKAGWLSSASDQQGVHIATTNPSRNIAKAQTVNTDLSRVQRGVPRVMETDSLDEETVLRVDDRGRDNGTRHGDRKILTSSDRRSVRGMEVQNSADDSQDGAPVGRIRSAAKASFDVSKDTAYSNTMRKLNEPDAIGKAKINKITREGVEITTNVGRVDRTITEDIGDEGVTVASVRHTSRASSEGIDIKDTSGTHRKADKKSQKVESYRNETTDLVINTKIPARVRIARHIDPSFPASWPFEGKMAERLERVKNYDSLSPLFLEALYAAEGDNFRKVLHTEYSKQFPK